MKNTEGRAKSNTVELEAVLSVVNDFSERVDQFKNNKNLREYLRLEKQDRNLILSSMTRKVQDYLPGDFFDFKAFDRAYNEKLYSSLQEQLECLNKKVTSTLYDNLPGKEKDLAKFLNRALESYVARKENPHFQEIYSEQVHDPRILEINNLSDDELDYYSEIRAALEKPLEKIVLKYLESRTIDLPQFEKQMMKAYKWGFLERLCLTYAEELDYAVQSFNPVYESQIKTLQEIGARLRKIDQSTTRNLKDPQNEPEFRQALEQMVCDYHPGQSVNLGLLSSALREGYFELVDGALFLLKKKNLEQLMDEKRISLENAAISMVCHLSNFKTELAGNKLGRQGNPEEFREDLNNLLNRYDSLHEELFAKVNPLNILRQVALCGQAKQAYDYAGMLIAKLVRKVSDPDTANELLKDIKDTEVNIILQVIKGETIKVDFENKQVEYLPYASESKPTAALQSVYIINTTERKTPIHLVEIRKIEVMELPGEGQYVRLPIETLYGRGEVRDVTSNVTYHLKPGFEMDLKDIFASFGISVEEAEKKLEPVSTLSYEPVQRSPIVESKIVS
ncbi:MAG: hypothetical protein ABIA37_05110 [Candidatus Woesearchaeota archaeon]